MEVSLSQLEVALQKSWCDETRSPMVSNSANPARGQCVPTALVVQDLLGGDLDKLETIFDGRRETHYRNLLLDKRVIDFTRSQYPPEQVLAVSNPKLGGYHSLRDKLIADNETKRRFLLLKELVYKQLGIGKID